MIPEMRVALFLLFFTLLVLIYTIRIMVWVALAVGLWMLFRASFHLVQLDNCMYWFIGMAALSLRVLWSGLRAFATWIRGTSDVD